MSVKSPSTWRESTSQRDGRCRSRNSGRKRRVSAGIGILALALAAAACGGASGNGAGSKGGNGTLEIGVSTIPTSPDPGQEASVEGLGILHLVSGTLTDQDADGKNVSMGLAASVELGEERALVKLKPDLTFSDGSALTAADVVASFEHLLADKTNGHLHLFEAIDGVTAVDDLTVAFDLKHPAPTLPFVLAEPAAHIIPSEAIEAKGSENLYSGDPVPNAGPFRIASLEQHQITLKANPSYAGERPSTTTVVFKKITDPAARVVQVRGGEIDFAAAVSPKQVGELSGSVEVRATRSVNGGYYVGMNNRDDNVLADVRIRKAIAQAINREQINKIAFGGHSKPMLGLFATSSRYSEPFLSQAPDISGAKELLAGTACESGCTLRYLTASDDDIRNDTAVVVQQNLRAIGINVTLQRVEKAVMFEMAAEGKYDLYAAGLYSGADYPDGFVSTLLGPSHNALGTGYSNAEVRQQIDTLLTATGSAREAAIERIRAMFEEDVPLAPVADYVVISASRVPQEVFHVEPSLYYHVG